MSMNISAGDAVLACYSGTESTWHECWPVMLQAGTVHSVLRVEKKQQKWPFETDEMMWHSLSIIEKWLGNETVNSPEESSLWLVWMWTRPASPPVWSSVQWWTQRSVCWRWCRVRRRWCSGRGGSSGWRWGTCASWGWRGCHSHTSRCLHSTVTTTRVLVHQWTHSPGSNE